MNNRRYNDNYDNQPPRRNQRPEYNDYDDRNDRDSRPPRRQDNYDDYDRPPRRDDYNGRPNNNYYPPKKSNTALILGLVAIGAVAAIAGFAYLSKKDATAQIISVSPNIVSTQKPYESCHRVGTTTYVKNQKNGTEGALIGGATGAVAGGIIGNQIKQGGGGTAVGALVGGATGALVGDQVQKANQPDYIAKKGSSNQCHTAYKTVQAQNGYVVQYMYKDNTATIITQNAPAVGSKIPMEQLQAMAVPSNNQVIQTQ